MKHLYIKFKISEVFELIDLDLYKPLIINYS